MPSGTGQTVLSDQVQAEIDRWVAKFPQGRQRSAVIAALQAVQHENGGFVTPELMDAVANYLDLPAVQAYEIATFYSVVMRFCRTLSRSLVSRWEKAHRTARSI